MKNTVSKTLALATALLAVGTLSAQTNKAPMCKPHEFTVGAIGYANTSVLYNGEIEINKNYSFGIGYSAGVSCSYALNDILSLAAQVNFAQLSSERKDVQPLLPSSSLISPTHQLYANYKKNEVFDCFNVPVMLRVNTMAGKHIKLFVNAGPSIGFIAKSKVETSGRSPLYTDLTGITTEGVAGTVYSFDGTQITTPQMNTVNVAMTGGIGVGYAFGKHCIALDARYDIGLTNVRTNTAINGRNNLQTLMAGIGYSYAIFN